MILIKEERNIRKLDIISAATERFGKASLIGYEGQSFEDINRREGHFALGSLYFDTQIRNLDVEF